MNTATIFLLGLLFFLILGTAIFAMQMLRQYGKEGRDAPLYRRTGRQMKSLQKLGDTMRSPWGEENSQLNELSDRVEALKREKGE
jgi:hypothetical protein